MLVLIVAVALLVDVALSPTRGGENDNASGCAVALALAQRLRPLEHLDLHLLFSGARHAGAAGTRAFLARHDLPRERAIFLNVDRVGSGEVRYTRSHPQLGALCDQIVEDDFPAAPLNTRETNDGSAAGSRRFAAVTVTCRDHGDYASGRVEERSLESAVAFCTELIERIDAELGPSLAAPLAETALSESR
jgi:Peptidase family M28